MELFILVKLTVIILLVTGNAFFVGSEIALTSARKSRIQHLVNQGDTNCKGLCRSFIPNRNDSTQSHRSA